MHIYSLMLHKDRGENAVRVALHAESVVDYINNHRAFGHDKRISGDATNEEITDRVDAVARCSR